MAADEEPLQLIKTIVLDSDSDDERGSCRTSCMSEDSSHSEDEAIEEELVGLNMAQRARNAKKAAQTALKKKLAKLRKKKKKKDDAGSKDQKSKPAKSGKSAKKPTSKPKATPKKSRSQRSAERKKRKLQGEVEKSGNAGSQPSGSSSSSSTSSTSGTGAEAKPRKSSRKKRQRKSDETGADKTDSAAASVGKKTEGGSAEQNKQKKKKVGEKDGKDEKKDEGGSTDQQKQKKKKVDGEKDGEGSDPKKQKKKKSGEKEDDEEGEKGDSNAKKEDKEGADAEKKKKEKDSGSLSLGGLPDTGGGAGAGSDTSSLGGGGGGGDSGSGAGGGFTGGAAFGDEEVEDDTASAADLAATGTSPSEQAVPEDNLVGRQKKAEKAERKAEKKRRDAEKKKAADLKETQKRLSELEEENGELRKKREAALASYAENPSAARTQLETIDNRIKENQVQAGELETQASDFLRDDPGLVDEAALNIVNESAVAVDNRGKPDMELFDGSFRRTIREVGSFPDPAPFPVVDGIPDDIGKDVLLEQEETLDAMNDDNEADELEGEAEDSSGDDEDRPSPSEIPPFEGGEMYARQKKKTRNWFQDALNGRKGTLGKARDFFSGFSGSTFSKGGTYPVVKKEDLKWMKATPDDPFFGFVRPTASTSASELVILPEFSVVADRVGKRVELAPFGGTNPIVNPDLWEPLLRARDRWRAAVMANEALPQQVRLFIANRYALRTSMYAPIFGWTEEAIQRKLGRLYQRGITRGTALFMAYSKSGQYTFATCRRLARVADMMRAVQLDAAKLRLFMVVTRQSQDPRFAELLLEALKMYIAIHLWFGVRDSYMVVLSTQLTGDPWFDNKVMPGINLLRWCVFPDKAPLSRLIADGRIGPHDLFVPAEPDDLVYSFFARGALAMAEEKRKGNALGDSSVRLKEDRVSEDPNKKGTLAEAEASSASSQVSPYAVSEEDARALSLMAEYKATVETKNLRMPSHAGAGVKAGDTLRSVVNMFGSSFARMALYSQAHPDLPLSKVPHSDVLRYVVPLHYWFLLSHSDKVTDMYSKLVFLRLASIARALATKGEASLAKWKDITALLGIHDETAAEVAASQISVKTFLADPRSAKEPYYIMTALRAVLLPADKRIIEEAVPAPGWRPPALHIMEKGLQAVAVRVDELLLDSIDKTHKVKAQLLSTLAVISQKSVHGRFDFDLNAQEFQHLSFEWGEAIAKWVNDARVKSVNQQASLKTMVQKAKNMGAWFEKAAGKRGYALWSGYIHMVIVKAREERGASDYDDLRALGAVLDGTRKTMAYTVSQKKLEDARSSSEMAAHLALSNADYRVEEEVPHQIRDMSTLALLQALLRDSFWDPKPCSQQEEAHAWSQMSRKLLIEQQEDDEIHRAAEHRIYRRVHRLITECLGPTRGAKVIRFFMQNEKQQMGWTYFFVWWVFHNAPRDVLLCLEDVGHTLSDMHSGVLNACEAICLIPGEKAKKMWEAVEAAILDAQRVHNSSTLPKPCSEDTSCHFKIHQHNLVNGYYALLLMPLYGGGFSPRAQETDWFSLQALGGVSDPLVEARVLGGSILDAIRTTLSGASEIYYAFADQLLVARVCQARRLWSACDQQNDVRLEHEFDKASNYLQKAIRLVQAIDVPTARVLSALYEACLVQTDPDDCFALFRMAFS